MMCTCLCVCVGEHASVRSQMRQFAEDCADYFRLMLVEHSAKLSEHLTTPSTRICEPALRAQVKKGN